MQALVADLRDKHRPAVLLVTHDVDEAILLADRIVVLQEGLAGRLRGRSAPPAPASSGHEKARGLVSLLTCRGGRTRGSHGLRQRPSPDGD